MEWFRLYDCVLDDPKVQRLPPPLFKHWINLLCLANQSTPRGTLPAVPDIAFRLRIGEDQAHDVIAQLNAAGLLDQGETLEPHNWPNRQKRSDDSAPRVAKHRATKDETLPPNDPVTLPKRYGNALEQNRVEKNREEQTTPLPPKTPTNGTPPPPDYAETLNGSIPVLVEKYTAIDPLLNETWLRGFLARAGSEFGPMPSPKLMTAFGLAHRQIEKRMGSPGDHPIRSPRKFAETVIREQLQEQRP